MVIVEATKSTVTVNGEELKPCVTASHTLYAKPPQAWKHEPDYRIRKSHACNSGLSHDDALAVLCYEDVAIQNKTPPSRR